MKQKRIKDMKANGTYVCMMCHSELSKIYAKAIGCETSLDHQFCVSKTMRQNIVETLPLIKEWVESGYALERECDGKYLIVYDQADKDKQLLTANKEGLAIMTKDEFSAIIEKQ